VVEVRGVFGVRHPDDPEPVESTKVVAARLLAAVGVALSPFVGGAIPALIALMLARQAEADIRASEGFLLGASRLPLIRRLAWIALGIATAVVVAGLLLWVLSLARAAGDPSYDGGVAVSG
jgi:(hydroxyamino)benzene mutase